MKDRREVRIIYYSCMCSEEVFNNLFGESTQIPGQQVQKYHRTLLKGFSRIKNVRIECFSKYPINYYNCKKKFVAKKREVWNCVKINYFPSVNIPILGNIFQTLCSFWSIITCTSKEKTIAIIDVLNISMNKGILFACALKKIKVVGIVTDLPEMLVDDKKSAFVTQGDKIISKCDAYVLLTEAMNERINPYKSKPYVVIEGQIDSEMAHIKKDLKNESDVKVCMYSGSLNKIHGIKYLVEGFLMAELENTELHIYGNGDYVDELLKLCEINSNIKYKGVKLNHEIVKAQVEATLLINPRPTSQEFVKYSFPSKNMEYMASGTPVLTTRLPGMPKEYEELVYLIDEETSEGISSCLRKVLKEPDDKLHAFGNKTKEYVLRNKTGECAAKKILELINGLVAQ